MDWTPVITQAMDAVFSLGLLILVLSVKTLFAKGKGQNNLILKTICELAYREIERNLATESGEQKLKMAIEVVKKRLEGTEVVKHINEQQIVDALQEAWFQNEGKYKP